MTIKTFVFNPFQENTYVVYDENGEAAVIDAGCLFEEERQELKKFIEQQGLILKRVLNTHLHLDHIFGNKFLFDTYGLAPEAAREDEFWLDAFPQSMQAFGLTPGMGQAQAIGKYLTENQEIKIGNITFTVLSVPGHSPGSLAFYSAKDGVVFSGDALFQSSIGRTDLAQGDYATLIRAIREKLFSLPDETVVYSGHGPETTIGAEKRFNPFL